MSPSEKFELVVSLAACVLNIANRRQIGASIFRNSMVHRGGIAIRSKILHRNHHILQYSKHRLWRSAGSADPNELSHIRMLQKLLLRTSMPRASNPIRANSTVYPPSRQPRSTIRLPAILP
jgi:hypothetical protein